MHRYVKVLVFAVIANILLIQNTGCITSTPLPETVVPEQISFDGDEQNAGIIGFTEDEGFEVTPHFRNRFNALVRVYGDRFHPRLRRDQGLTKLENGNWRINRQSMVYFLDMNQWRRDALE